MHRQGGGRARAIQCNQQRRALDATVKCPCRLLASLLLPAASGRAIAGHQCIRVLPEGQLTGRPIGQTAPKRCVTTLVLFCFGCCAIIPLQLLQQLRSHRWPAVSRCRAMDAEREGRISLPMLACHAAAASQPPNLENAATPRLQPTRSTPPAGRDPPRSFVRAQLQRSGAMLKILAPHSTDLVPPNDLSSHALGPAFVTHHHPRHKHARHSQLGFVFASRATLCSATGQRLSIVSTNWPIRPEDHLCKLVLAAGSGRLPGQRRAWLA